MALNVGAAPYVRVGRGGVLFRTVERKAEGCWVEVGGGGIIIISRVIGVGVGERGRD